MRLIFAGTPEVAVPSLEALLVSSRHDVVAVVSRPDARTGRGRSLSRSPVAAAADAAGIEVLTPPNARDPEFAERLRELAPDAVPVVASGPPPVRDASQRSNSPDISPPGRLRLRGAPPRRGGSVHYQGTARAADRRTCPRAGG